MSSSDRKVAVMPDKSKKHGMLVQHFYGKSRVRMTKLSRRPDRHELLELSVDINLEGKFEDTFITGDNSLVVATDSMKNTVYVLGAKHDFDSIEDFAKILSAHFLQQYLHVEGANISITEDLWQRIDLDGKPHQHAFFGAGAEKRSVTLKETRQSIAIESGIDNLRVVKTTNSAFLGFIRDSYTTLPDAKDRIFGTTVSARWLHDGENSDFNTCYHTARQAVLEIFATHASLSVQQTLHEIAQTTLERCPSIKSITLTMPNQHRIPFNLEPFGLENRNEIFITTDEPYGLISASIART
jgi:urate oxidase